MFFFILSVKAQSRILMLYTKAKTNIIPKKNFPYSLLPAVTKNNK